jgi:hypothetical protein
LKTRIDINIDRIILEDFPAGGEPMIKRAIESELNRLIAENDTIDFNRQVDKYRIVSENEIKMDDGSSHESIGRQIAQSIFKQLSG